MLFVHCQGEDLYHQYNFSGLATVGTRSGDVRQRGKLQVEAFPLIRGHLLGRYVPQLSPLCTNRHLTGKARRKARMHTCQDAPAGYVCMRLREGLLAGVMQRLLSGM